MKKFLLVLSVICLICGLGGPAWSEMIFNTGIEQHGSVLSFDSTSWYANQFTTSQDYYITALSGYMGYNGPGSTGQVQIVIYDNADKIPAGVDGHGHQHFTFSEQVFSVSFDAVSAYSWQGRSDLNQLLAAGTYWIAFQTALYDGYIANSSSNSGLPVYAGTEGGTWQNFANTNVAYRIEASTSPVPIPAILLFAPGLAGLAIVRRRFKK